MAFSRQSQVTQQLTRAPVVLTVKRASRRWPKCVCFFLLLSLAMTGAVLLTDAWKQWAWWPQWLQIETHSADGSDVPKSAQQWQKELNVLQNEIERMKTEREIDTSVRQGLEQKIVELQEQLRKTELQLKFVKTR